MKFCLFDHTRAVQPQAYDLTWEAFCTEIIGREHRQTALPKDQVPLFSPVEYAPGTTRGNKNVVAIHALALDFDKLPDATTDATLQRLIDAGLSFVAYTSFSHAARHAADGSSSFRVVIELSRPVTPAEWPGFWTAVVGQLALLCDPACKDAARIYALAYASDTTGATINVNPGKPIDVDIVLPSAAVNPQPPRETPRLGVVTPDELRLAAAKITKKSGDKAKLEAACLRKIAKGDAYQTPKDGRHTVMLTITSALVREFPYATTEALASTLDVSHKVMQTDDPSYDAAARHIDAARAIDGARNKRDVFITELREQEQANKAQANLAARADGKDTAYSEAELADICARNDFSRAELPKRWIMRKGEGSCYVLTLKGYRGPYSKGEIITVARDYLPPAGITVVKLTKEGQRYKTPTELLDECSSNFEISQVVLGEDHGHTTREGAKIIMHEAACERAGITSEYSERAERYAKLLGAAHPEKFFDWLATYDDLSRPSCAIYLEGAPGVGKSVFGEAIARMWRNAVPVTLGNARGDFNDCLTSSPIVTVDEGWPDKLKAADSSVFRDFVSRTSHELSRKYMSGSKIIGAMRLVLTANSDKLLKFSDLDSQDAREAVATRLLHLPIPEGSENPFAKDPTLFQHLVTDRGFAKYCLWLKANRVVTAPPERVGFWVTGEMSSSITGMALASDASTQVCEWAAGIVANPKLLGTRYKGLVRIEDGELYVNTAAYVGTFEQILSSKAYKLPTLAAAGRAIAQLAEPQRVKRTVGGHRLDFYHMRKALLAEGIDRDTLGSKEDFLDKISNGGILGE